MLSNYFHGLSNGFLTERQDELMNALEQNKRDKALDVLKGIGIITMIMGHSNMGSLFEIYIAGFHMQLFFLVSGFLFRPNRYSTFTSYLQRKISTIIVPYFFYAIATIMICEISDLITGNNSFFLTLYIKGIVWSNQSIFPITGAIWFLQCIFWIEIIYFFISKIKSKIYSSILILFILIISARFAIVNVHLPFSLDSALSGLVFYHIGHLIGNNKKASEFFFKKLHVIGWFVIFALNTVLIFYNGSVNPRTCSYGLVPLYYLNALCGTWVWYCVAKWLSNCDKFPFKFLGNYLSDIGLNSVVYLGLNQLTIRGLYNLSLTLLSTNNRYIRAGRNIIICILTLALCYGYTYILNNRYFSWLIGKENKKT